MNNIQPTHVAIALFVLAVVILFTHARSLSQKNKRLQQSVDYYSSTFLRKNGYLKGFGNYTLQSFDGALTWHATEREGSAVKVIGMAEDVFPGLLDQLEGMDALKRYVVQNGPITLSSDNVANELKLLTNAGFTVERK